MKYVTQSDEIRILLIKKGLSINAAAKRIKLPPSELSKIIHGHQAYFDYRPRLAKLLGVPVEEIFPDGDRQAS